MKSKPVPLSKTSIEGNIGVAQFKTGFGIVRVRKLRHLREQISALYRYVEFQDDTGRPYKGRYWVALREQIDLDSGDRTILDCKVCESEAIAMRFASEWKRNTERKKAQCAKAVKDAAPENLLGTKPPADCEALSRFDLEDAAKARLSVLRRQWPRCFEIFDARKSGALATKVQIQEAYLVDTAALTGRILNEDAALSGELVNALFTAQRRFRRGKSAILLRLVDYEIALNWFPPESYCFLTEGELAKRINELLHTNFSAGAISQRRAALGLTAKRKTGPPAR